MFNARTPATKPTAPRPALPSANAVISELNLELAALLAEFDADRRARRGNAKTSRAIRAPLPACAAQISSTAFAVRPSNPL